MNSTERYFAQDYATQLPDRSRPFRIRIDQYRNDPGWGRPEDLAKADALEAALDSIARAFGK